MACEPVDEVLAEWIDGNKSILCEWEDSGDDRTGFYVGLEGEPFGPAKPETLMMEKVDSEKTSHVFAGAGKWFGKVLRCWVKAVCKDCTESEAVTSEDLPIE